jgi:glycerophosphoryl diester phosphodiesterase
MLDRNFHGSRLPSSRIRHGLPVLIVAAILASGCDQGLGSLAPDYICESVQLAVIPPGRKLLIAHRGATRMYPENTEEALVAAADYDANAVELDVVLTADGVVVVHHDYTLNRMTDCGGDLRTKNWADIQDCKVSDKYALPRLDLLLPKLMGYRKVFIEIKTDDDQAEAAALAVGTIVHDLVAYDRVVVTSYNLRTLYHLKTLFPDPAIPIGYDGAGAAIPLATINMGFQYMLSRMSDIDRCVFSTAQQMGVKLITYTVTDREDLFDAMSGLFRDHAYGIMFDNIESFGSDRRDLRRERGLDIPTRRSCETDGGLWDPATWSCIRPCTTESCPVGETCSAVTLKCEHLDSDIPDLVAVMGRLNEIVLLGQRSCMASDPEGIAEASGMLAELLAPDSVYQDNTGLLARVLFGMDTPLGALVDASRVDVVDVTRPTARVVTKGGTEWYFTLTIHGWSLDHVTTW